MKGGYNRAAMKRAQPKMKATLGAGRIPVRTATTGRVRVSRKQQV